MTTKPKFDLKNSKKFQDRVKKLQGNQHIRLIKDPVSIQIQGLNANVPTWIAAIGLNDSYLIVEWTYNERGITQFPIAVGWTRTQEAPREDAKQENVHDRISNFMLNWLMMHSNESDFIQVKPSAISVKDVAFKTIETKVGTSELSGLGKGFQMLIQGTLVQVENPYHK